MGGYQRERDEQALPMYEFTCQLATMERPPDQQSHRAQFFSPENVGAIMAAAGPGAAAPFTSR